MTKKEILGTTIILALIFLASLYNFKIALRRSRDAQRKADIRAVTDALNKYQSDFGFLPESQDNKIKACAPAFSVCEWGKSGIYDLSDASYPPYIKILPIDPDSKKGASYYYSGNGRRFQVLAALEGKDEPEYDAKIEARGVFCGSRICNYGLSSGDTPLDKSIEQYERELEEAAEAARQKERLKLK